MQMAQLNKQLEELAVRERFSGVMRVTQKDQILLERSFGYDNRETKRPFTADSVFTLYSMSKPFCAIGLLLLADQGLVDIDKHPGVYVPEAQGFDPRVTIRHMLHHVSGLPDFFCVEDWKADPPEDHHTNIRKYLRLLCDQPQHFVPGTDGLYRNINFTIPALIIENVTGMAYPDYMEKMVFAPLGAVTLTVDHQGLQLPNRVQGYRLNDRDQIEPTDRYHAWMLGGGDLVGRVEDVYCLNKAIKHRLLLKPETWEQVLTPNPINQKGMGCTVTQWHGKQRITHNGGHLGFRSFHVQLPEDDLDMIILSNAGFGGFRQEAIELVYKAIYDENARSEAPMLLDYGIL